jgi:hypothetical protein
MKWLIGRTALLFLASLSLVVSAAHAAELTRVELDTDPLHCDNWATFPTKAWTNATGHDQQIKIVEAKVASAQSLQGQIGIWLSRGTGPFQQSPGMIWSFGYSAFAPPSQQVVDRINFGTDYQTVKAGDSLTMTVNCGPVNSSPAPFWYVAVIVLYMTPAP